MGDRFYASRFLICPHVYKSGDNIYLMLPPLESCSYGPYLDLLLDLLLLLLSEMHLFASRLYVAIDMFSSLHNLHVLKKKIKYK